MKTEGGRGARSEIKRPNLNLRLPRSLCHAPDSIQPKLRLTCHGNALPWY